MKPIIKIPAKTVVNFKSAFLHKKLCDGITVSLDSSCGFACKFCFVPSMMWKGVYRQLDGREFQSVQLIRKNGLTILRDQCRRAKVRKEKLVCFMSPTSDVAADDSTASRHLDAIKIILAETSWDIRLLSKSSRLIELAAAAGDKSRLILGWSTGTADCEVASAVETGASLPIDRFIALRMAQDNGWRTFGMLCPILPNRDMPGLVERLCNEIRVDKCEQVWVEVLNSRGKAVEKTAAAIRGLSERPASAPPSAREDHWRWIADEIERRVGNEQRHDEYAREVFEAAAERITPDRLRFMQYAAKPFLNWWKAREALGAICL